MKTVELHILRDDEGKFKLKCETEMLPIAVIETILNDVAKKVEDITANKILSFLDEATNGLIGDISKNVIEAAERGEQLSATDEFIKAFKEGGGKTH